MAASENIRSDGPTGAEWDTAEFWQVVERLRAGDATAVESALRFLELDPWSFGSGYAKEQVARVLARYQFDDQQQARLARVAIRAVDVGDRWEFRWYCRLANRIDAALLRDDLTRRLRTLILGWPAGPCGCWPACATLNSLTQTSTTPGRWCCAWPRLPSRLHGGDH